MKDFYYILGLESNCALDDIKEAYRKLSKKLHPDLNQGDKYFENRFRDIKEAWETLRDPVKKNQYDQDLLKYRSNLSGQQARKQEYYREPTYRHRPTATPHKSKRKGPGVGMTIVFILMVLILGDYLVRTFNPPKKTITINAAPEAAAIFAKTPKHHKKRHSIKNKNVSDSARLYAANEDHAYIPTKKTIEKPVEPNSFEAKPVAQRDEMPVSVTSARPEASTVKKATASAIKSQPSAQIKQRTVAPGLTNYQPINSSYTTYVRPNPTGVVNMREFDSFGSVIVQTIPANARVVVIARGETYYRVSYNNVVGYVPKWSLQNK